MKVTAKLKKNKSNQLDGILKRFKSLNNETLKVGFFEEQGMHEDSEMSYASLMTILEKGTSDGRIQPRPVFETTAFQLHPSAVQKPKSIITNMIKDLGTKDTVGKRLDELGMLYQDHVKNKFGNAAVKGNSNNAESTIRQKGNNTPLVDTEDLKNNVAYKNSKTKRLKLG